MGLSPADAAPPQALRTGQAWVYATPRPTAAPAAERGRSWAWQWDRRQMHRFSPSQSVERSEMAEIFERRTPSVREVEQVNFLHQNQADKKNQSVSLVYENGQRSLDLVLTLTWFIQ
ncbi:hypothetical protein B296_00024800 [Ensete ventricosum]|uniref:Uncharacterized protein n=1 Tax=Ensete ventricosum TaxID=4639 RepID=A0A426ZBQ2_ENSVE|nr:hypothetical protein B296_00024800 [Ensete ventricosum]